MHSRQLSSDWKCTIGGALLQTEEEKQVKVSFLRLLRLVRGDWPWIFFGCVAAMLLGTIQPIFAVVLSEIINALIPYSPGPPEIGSPASTAVKWAAGFFAFGVGYLIMATIQGYSFAVVGANLAEKVRQLFFKSVLYMEVGWFDEDANTSGALTSRLASDAPSVRGAVADVLGVVIQNLTTMVAAFTIAFVYGWEMTLLIIGVLPLLVFASFAQIKFFTGACRQPLCGVQLAGCARLVGMHDTDVFRSHVPAVASMYATPRRSTC